jgi:hypothetical protein
VQVFDALLVALQNQLGHNMRVLTGVSGNEGCDWAEHMSVRDLLAWERKLLPLHAGSLHLLIYLTMFTLMN